MARMSQLLLEALALDEARRRAWLDALPPEQRDLAAALRDALLPEAAQAAQLKALMSLPQLGAADGANTACDCWAPGAWPRCGWRGAPMGP
jgi:hypothetical protein